MQVLSISLDDELSPNSLGPWGGVLSIIGLILAFV